MNQRTTWWQRSRGARIGLTIMVLLTVCNLSACAAQGGTQTVPTATVQGTIPQSAAILGGSVFAFNAKFGGSKCCFENGWTYQGLYGRMWTGVDTGDPAGDMGSPFNATSTKRVISIDNVGQFLGTTWNVRQAKAICGSYLPPDAKDMGTMNVYDVSGSSVIGLEAHYSSTSLATTLPSTAFKDVNGKPTAPGGFSIYYEYTFPASEPPLVDWCTLSTDETHKNPY